jgi:hypothetical protein
MSAAKSWFVSVLGVLSLILALHSLGLNVTVGLGTVLHGAEHLLGQPLVVR